MIHDATPAPAATVAELPRPGEFVAVNYISCTDGYRERFETLFSSRAHAIDRAPGFRHMSVLRPACAGGDYLVVSFWKDRASFESWSKSPEFLEGHRRGFADIKQARERGEQPPMTSRMETYDILCD
jgi:heme-degrading monooxygenase HmoA